MSSRTEILAELNAELRALLDQQTGIAALPSDWRNKSEMVAAIASDIAALRAEIDAESSAFSNADTIVIRRASGVEYTLPLSALILPNHKDLHGRLSGDQIANGSTRLITYWNGYVGGSNINHFSVIMASGTATISLALDGTPVTNSAISADNTRKNITPSALNSLGSGAQMTIIIADLTGTPAYIDFSISID